MSAHAAKLRAARKRARVASAAIDEGLLQVSAGIDRIVNDRTELLVAVETLQHFVFHHGGCAFIDGDCGSVCDCGLDEAEDHARAALKEARAR